MSKFTHLHTHSHYSLLDGLPKIDQLLDCAAELKMDSLALTDHGNIYGAVEFYKKALERGIKPIIGSELYMALEKMIDKRPNIDDARYHLVLLVKNKEGYRNLVKLITKAHLEGFYYKPRIDEALLTQHSEGLIGLSACLRGKIPRLILAKKTEEAERVARKYQEIFGKDNFYLEIQHHPNFQDQKIANKGLISISKKLGIPLVATNDIHYVKPDDAEAQDILMLINTGSNPNDPERLTLKADDFSMRSQEQMIKDFNELPEAISNTQKIADLCNFQFELGKVKLPQFAVPTGQTPEEYLEELCQKGLKTKFGEKPAEQTIERLEYELSIIKQTGFASYFLIVQDFVNWAKENRIVVGPGRGSAGGSLTAYLLNITNINPLKYNLFFERFLNPDRISLPDFDLDFTDRRRDEVIRYVTQKYGQDKVAQIITFGTMAARAVVRDVGRAMEYAYSYCDRVAKMIPFGMSLTDCLKQVTEFRSLYESDPKAKKLIDTAKKLEGVARHASTHACGVVISNTPLDEIVPLQHPTQNDQAIVTQYEMHSIEDLGLLKIDILGLKNLTIIEDTLSRIYAIHGININIDNIPEEDKKAYKLLQKGETVGIFQLESQGVQRYLKQLKPNEFEDIIAMVSLYRPGPIQLIPDYIARKNKKQKGEEDKSSSSPFAGAREGEIQYFHPKLKPILEKTYGIPVYQEQIMQIAKDMAGFTLAEADVLRKAIGKKIRKLLISQKEKFIEGMKKNEISEQIAQQIWYWIEPFASYSFNRCVTGDTQIVDTRTGKIFTLEELYKKQSQLPRVLSCGKNLKLKKSKTKKIFYNGIKPIYEVTTQLGRKIKTTLNHPFLTIKGWEILKNLKRGEKIAVPRALPLLNKKPYPIKRHQLVVLGYLLAEGNLCHPHGFYFFSNNKEEREDYLKALEKFKNTKGKIDTKRKSAPSIYAGRINLKKKAEAVEWIRNLGLKYKKATQKEFPAFVFQLNKKQLSLLLGKLFQGDGCINLKRKNPEIFYSTSSYKLAFQFQHLLLRLGIVSKLNFKKFKYRKEIKKGYTVTITRYENIKNFINTIGNYLISAKKETNAKILKSHPILTGELRKNAARGSKDTVPTEIREILRNEVKKRCFSIKEFARKYKIAWRLFFKDRRKRGYLRETLEYIGKILKSKLILNYAHSDIYWDSIVKIKYIGVRPTFDLNINPTHNYVANDIIVHNSHAAAYATIAYQTAYLKSHYPQEFMSSLLTSERNDTERIAVLIEECKKRGIVVLPPDINESFTFFSVVPKKNQIRFGLSAIKNVGSNIVELIVNERKANGPYASIENFISRINSKNLNKKSLESLIKAGVFDKMAERNQLLCNLERLLEYSRENQKSKINGQAGLFEQMGFNNKLTLAKTAPASEKEMLTWEKELLGLFVSSHPLNGLEKTLEKKVISISKIPQGSLRRNVKVKIGGIISKIKKIITRTGKPMLFIDVEDLSSKIEVVVFPRIIERNPAVFQENKIVIVSGRLDSKDGVPKVIAEEIEMVLES